MSWELKVYSEDGATLQKTITDGVDPTSGKICVRGAPEAIVTPRGATEELIFHARRDRADIGPRQRVQFVVGGLEAAFGVVIVCPPPGSMGAGSPEEEHLERYALAGLELVLDQTTVVPRFFPDFDTVTVLSQDIAKVAFRISNFSAPAGILVTDANFPVIGQDVPNLFEPERTLSEVLDLLASMVTGGATWWVDTGAELHFEVT